MIPIPIFYFALFPDKSLSDELDEILLLTNSHDDNFIAVPGNAQIAGVSENNHRARVFIDRGLMRDLFNVDVEHPTRRQIDCFGVHQIAAEKDFDPVAIFGYGENDAGSVLDRRDRFFAAGQLGKFTVGTFAQVFVPLGALSVFARDRFFPIC